MGRGQVGLPLGPLCTVEDVDLGGSAGGASRPAHWLRPLSGRKQALRIGPATQGPSLAPPHALVSGDGSGVGWPVSGLLLRRALRRPPESGAGLPGGRGAVCTVIAATPRLGVPRSPWLLLRSALLGRFHRVPDPSHPSQGSVCVEWDPRSRVARDGRGDPSRGRNGSSRGWTPLAGPGALQLGAGHQGEGTALVSSCCRHCGPEPSGDLNNSP